MAKKRNPFIAQGVTKYGRSRMYSIKKLWLIKKGPFVKKQAKVEQKKKEEKPKLKKEPRWYTADDVKRPLPSRKNRHKTAHLRPSITKGTVLILLAGRHKGKRVIFLKKLRSGLLLVTGPFKLNGVPLRRVNQAYVIATSTKVDVSKVDVSKVGDYFFKRAAAPKKSKKDGEKFFNTEKKKNTITEERKAAQKTVDASLLEAIELESQLRV